MSLTKVNYIDNSTIITAKNLNDIQDNIIELNNNSISKDNIINNFTTTEEGFVADARALKALNDNLLSLFQVKNGGMINDFNVQNRTRGTWTMYTFPQNAANTPSASSSGYLFMYTAHDSADWGGQIAFYNGHIKSRALNNGVYGSWETVI